MGFRELVSQVQNYSGLSNEESKDTLELLVESIAVRISEQQRSLFASQLPEYLSDIVLSVYPSEENSSGDLINQFMQYENLNENRAIQHIQAAWHALKGAISEKLLLQIKSQMPLTTSSLLS